MTDSNLAEALERINEIHGHMAKGEIYRGYRPLPIAIAGAGGLVGAAVQGFVINPGDSLAFVYFWLGVAGLSAALAEPMVLVHLMRQSSYERRRTLHVWGQFIPCLVAGALVGLGVSNALPEATSLLPGLWTMIFSLGVFSSRPFLPRATGWVALYYLTAGAWLVLNPPDITQPLWPLAWIFFIGQCAGGLIIYLNIERTCPDVEEI